MGKRQDLMFKFIILAVVSYPIFYNSENTLTTVVFSWILTEEVAEAIEEVSEDDVW